MTFTDTEKSQLFRDFGVFAHTIIHNQEVQEREYEEQLAWDAVKPLRDDGGEEVDEEIDTGYREPDTYGCDDIEQVCYRDRMSLGACAAWTCE